MGKLVRDRIPEVIRAGGEEPVVRVVDDEEYRSELLHKLVEEAREAQEAETAERLLEELADVYEVVIALAAASGRTLSALQAVAREKARERGCFTHRFYLEAVSPKR